MSDHLPLPRRGGAPEPVAARPATDQPAGEPTTAPDAAVLARVADLLRREPGAPGTGGEGAPPHPLT